MTVQRVESQIVDLHIAQGQIHVNNALIHRIGPSAFAIILDAKAKYYDSSLGCLEESWDLRLFSGESTLYAEQTISPTIITWKIPHGSADMPWLSLCESSRYSTHVVIYLLPETPLISASTKSS